MISQEEKPQFLKCPDCQGTGRGKMGFSCYNCQGMGQGAFLKGHFLFFSLKLNAENIKFPPLKEKIDKIIQILVFSLGGLGVISLLVWFYWHFSSLGSYSWQDIWFWQFQHQLILCFWLGAAFFMFGFYKLVKKRDEEVKIQVFKDPEKDFPESWEEVRKYGHKYNTASALGRDGHRVLAEAYKIAHKFKHEELSPLHLFVALATKDKKTFALFTRLNVDQEKLMNKLGRQLGKRKKIKKGKPPLKLSNEFKRIFILAFLDAYSLRQNNIKPLNILSYCVQEDELLKEILLDVKVDIKKIENVRAWFRTNEQIRQNIEKYKKMARFKPKTNMDRAYTSVATPFLNKCSRDMTLGARWGRLGLCVARDKEIKNIFNALTGSNNGVILVGSEGTGKRTVVEGVAKLMVEEEVPDFLWDKRLVELDVARLISGADPSQSEERILRVLDEVTRAGNIVLFVENINNLIGIKIGQGGGMDLSEALVDGMSRRGIYCLTTTTTGNFHQYVEETAITEAMAKVDILEPQGDQAIRIVESKIGQMEARFKGVFFTYNAVEAAIDMSRRYIHDQHLPQKAIDILEQTGVRLAKNKKKKDKYIFCTKNDVALTIKEITQIPVDEVSEGESDKLLNLEEEIHKHMINQNEAVNVVANSLRRARAELKEEKRTIANFLFLGPTGVGKTELAKTVSRVYLGKKDFMFRVDMSEYQHADSVKKMIGDGAGRKGYLTEAVRKNPFSLILLDEFEKAHPKILDLFLQVMDDGRLTDAEGKTIDFTSSIIIATSNAGSKFIEKQISAGEKLEKIKDDLVNDKLMQVMKPELINRFDGVIIFKPLSMKNVVEITRLMIKDIDKMLQQKGMFLQATEKGLKKIAEEGYDPKFGARPLRRTLREKVENKIAKKILSGDLKRRDTVIVNDEAEIEIKEAKEL